MGTFSYELQPKYGLHPKSMSEYFPGEDNGFPGYNAQIRRWTESAYEEAQWEYSQNAESQHIDKYMDYLLGKQWPRERASYKSAPVNNRIWRLFWELLALLTDARPFIDIRSTDKLYDQQALMLNKCMKAWWLDAEADMVLAMTIVYALLSTGYNKFTWNPDLRKNPGSRNRKDDGDFELIPIGPGDCLPIKARTNLQQSECVIYKSVQSLGWFKRKFPRGSLVQGDPNFSRYSVGSARPPHIPAMMWDMLAPQMRRLIGGKEQFSESVYPMALYREYWLKDYCVSPSTRILTADLSWKRADSLNVGDELIGCDEEIVSSHGVKRKSGDRKLRRSVVESVKSLRQPSLEITTDKGVVTCSTLHRWLVKTTGQARKRSDVSRWWIRYEWKRANEINPGDQIAFLVKPWEEEDSKDAGYLAGLLDGEGWLGKYAVGLAQKEGVVLSKAMALFEERGYETHVNRSNSSAFQVKVNGGREEVFRLIGSIRPPRLLAKSSCIWEGKQLRGKGVTPAKVLSVKDLGEREVLAIQTSEKTFIAEGFVSHNSTNTSNVPVSMGQQGTNWCYQVRPGEMLYPRGRLIIMGGEVCMHDGPNPYWHGKFPFSALRLNVVPWQFMGLSEFRAMIPLQDVINNLIAGIMDVIKKIVNPVFYAPRNAFSDSIWESLDWGMPGAKAAYNPMSPNKPEFGQAPALPGSVFQMLQWTCKEMDQGSGIASVADAARKKQVPSGDTLDNIKDTIQTPLRLKGRNTEIFLRDIGTQAIPNIFQFYTMERRMYLAGEDGKTFEDFDWDPKTAIPAGDDPEDHAHRFVFMIQPGTLLNIHRLEKAVALMRLRAIRDVSRKTLLEGLDIGINPDEEEKRLKEEMKNFPPPPVGKKQAGQATQGLKLQ